jgi:hypothetical protein
MKTISTIASIISLLLTLQAGLEFFETSSSQSPTKEASSEKENRNEAVVRISRYTPVTEQKNCEFNPCQATVAYKTPRARSISATGVALYIMHKSLLI